MKQMRFMEVCNVALRHFLFSFITVTIRIILSERHLEVNIANDTIEENEDNNP